MSQIQRVVLQEDPFQLDRQQVPWERGRLDAHFIGHPNAGEEPTFCEYEVEFELKLAKKFRMHVTADERYELYLNGQFAGRGSERGDPENWFFESYDVDLPAGVHHLRALVWSLGDSHAPYAQFYVRHGFLCIADDTEMKPLVTTGHAPWRTAKRAGVEMIKRTATFATGDRFKFIGANWHESRNWVEPVKTEKPLIPGAGDTYPNRFLERATLPAMMSKDWSHFRVRHVSAVENAQTAKVAIQAKNDLEKEHQLWADLLAGKAVTIPPNTRRRVIVDCEEYLCSYWHLKTAQGRDATFRIHWQESLYEDMKTSLKGNRNEIEGKFFGMTWWSVEGCGDTVVCGGEAEEFHAPWWLAGRYLELYVETKDQPLVIERLRLEETRFPLEPAVHPFRCSDDELNRISEICLRTLQMDAHDTFCDSPYYEQLMYVGDTRVEAMMTMALMEEVDLPRKATKLYQASIGANGLTQSRYPSRNRQYIAPFSLWWVMMVADQQLWRGDAAFVRSLMPGVRTVLSAFEFLIERDENSPAFGLLKAPEHWNYFDWVESWPVGIPPGGVDGYSIGIALQLLLAVEAAAELESIHGYAQSQRHYLLWATELRKAIKRQTRSNGLLKDAPDSDTSCEQVHALAILTNDPELRAIGQKWYELQPEGIRAKYYFQHYRHEALARIGRVPEIVENIRKEWGAMVKQGLVCTLEMSEPSRSDCHAWASHPLYHFQSKVLGLTPLEAYRFELRPHLCGLDWAEGYVSTGRGPIHARVERKGGGWIATLVVPDGVIVSIPEVKGMVSGPKTVTIDPS
jgi:alpha-L-rhamnosidase